VFVITYCNVWGVWVCVGMCGVCVCVGVCRYVWGVCMCGCVYVWVCVCVGVCRYVCGVCMCGCVYVWVCSDHCKVLRVFLASRRLLYFCDYGNVMPVLS
jgi:hypothetical protein